MRIPYMLVAVLLLVLTGFAAPARAKGLVVSTGHPGGFYETVARGLRAVLSAEDDTHIEVRTSPGSLENLALLDDPASSVALALTQVDALKGYIGDHPEFSDEYVELADIGKECVFIVTGKQDGITTIADLKGDGSGSLAVGTKGSGAAVTWEYMNRIEPAFRRTRPVNRGIIDSLLELKQTSQPSELSAAMLVQRPKAESTPLEIVLDQREDFRIIPIRAGDIDPSALEGGRTVYSFEKVTIGFGRDYQMTFDTLCTRGLLIGSKSKLDADQLAVLAGALARSRAYIVPGSD